MQYTRAEKSIKDISIKYCGFYLPPEAYYTTINDAPDDANKATLVKKAMEAIERENEKMDGVLPKEVYGQLVPEEGLKHCNSQLYPKDTVIITARGTVGNVILLGVPMAMNQSCFALKSDVLNSPYYLFFVIKNEVLKLKKMANGGVFDTIIIKTFDHIHITIPDNYILSSFNKQIEPMMNRIYTLQQQITNLTQQRDLLLPRLMSGKLEVE